LNAIPIFARDQISKNTKIKIKRNKKNQTIKISVKVAQLKEKE
jgi:hypothetical protein